ncbi:MAG: phosphatase PAP2 family protein [Acetivibrionales bacterium]
MPSGHAAVAFSVTTAIALWTGNAAVTLLSLMMSLLLVQSRLEGKIHSVLELVAGSLLGFLVTLLLFQLLYK